MRSTVTSTLKSFDSAFFGGPVYALKLEIGRADTEDLSTALRAEMGRLIGAGARIISCRVPSEAEEARDALVEQGLRQVEDLITLRFQNQESQAFDTDARIRQGRPDDQAVCSEIAKSAFVYDRYHADPLVSDEATDRFKAAWVTNGLTSRADASFVAEVDGGVAGFNLCLRREPIAHIDLIAVSETDTRTGLGRALVAAALDHYCDLTAIEVGTQATNTPSLALYTSMGFEPVGSQASYHWVG